MENFVPTLKRFIVNLILFLGGVGFVVAGIQYVNYLTGDKSYGIHVAKMAGLPSKVIERATQILKQHIYEKLNDGTEIPKETSDQLTFFQEQDNILRKELNKIDLNSMTPIEAIKYLDELKKEHDL